MTIGGRLALPVLVFGALWAPPATPMGPLRVDPRNPRYFEDPAGHVVYLAGDHTWSNFQDYGYADPPAPFDYRGFLDTLSAHGLNFFRLWRWEQATWQTDNPRDYHFTPNAYERTGPGVALDGKPKFDLTRLNQAYFDRMRERVAAAGERGIYVSVMLFNGWSIEDKGEGLANPWRGHPFNRANNINGIDGDPSGDGMGIETHSLRDPRILALEEAYVAKVIGTVGDLDNVLYEVSNESRPGSTAWQYAIIRYVKATEATRALQHPVGMTAEYPDGSNRSLFASPADWVSPSGPANAPPVADGEKVILWDTDHTCGICGSAATVWKAFTRGLNPVLMDPYDSTAPEVVYGLPRETLDPRAWSWVGQRLNMGVTMRIAHRLDLARLLPSPALSDSGYCLAGSPADYPNLVLFAPGGGRFSVDLSRYPGWFAADWINPRTGDEQPGGTVEGRARRIVEAPFAGDAALVLRSSLPVKEVSR